MTPRPPSGTGRLAFPWLERETVHESHRLDGNRSQSEHRVRDGRSAISAGCSGVNFCLNQERVHARAHIDQDEVEAMRAGRF